MVAPENTQLAVTKQCKLLGVSRSSHYYSPKVWSSEDFTLLRQLDELHLEHPTAGSRGLMLWLRRKHQLCINRKRVQRLMRVLGIVSQAPKPNLSMPNKQHVVYPYLLRGLSIDHPNQVWATDITYIPLERGHAYLVAVIDWYSRKVLSSRLSNTMDNTFCVAALEEAIEKFGCPEIFNSDQGSQFTSEDFTGTLKKHSIKISMDGKGRCLDNVMIERLWRSLKYEDVYLKRYSWMAEAKQGISAYLRLFNEERPHQSFDGKTPDEVYFASMKTRKLKAA